MSELIVDNFAGGGGASTGIEAALDRPIDYAINHDPLAIAMHRANHPHTKHFTTSVCDVDPRALAAGREVGLGWFSPDCTFHSKARGGKPFRDRDVARRRRGLAWLVPAWMRAVRPRVVMLENVEEFAQWGPLDGDGRPCPIRKGMTFRRWVKQIENLGYQLDMRELRACDYGAPTTRKRLFVIARCDGEEIVFPEATHGPGLSPYRAAAECIDWSLPCQSIFERSKPLAENTLRRIARGVMRYVVNNPQPFIVSVAHGGDQRPQLVAAFLARHYGGHENDGSAMNSPLHTITTKDHHALVCARVEKYDGRLGSSAAPGGGRGYSGEPGRLNLEDAKLEHDAIGGASPTRDAAQGWLSSRESLRREAAIHGHSASTCLDGAGRPCSKRDGLEPRGRRQGQQLTGELIFGDAWGQSSACVQDGPEKPFGPCAANRGGRQAAQGRGAVLLADCVEIGRESDHSFPSRERQVAAFLTVYYGTEQDPSLTGPLPTVTTKHRFGLVTVHGEQYRIVDIRMRMLAPRELYRAQSFADSYIIEHGMDELGEILPLTKTAQIHMCGNSVPPALSEALVRANYVHTAERSAAA